MPIFDIYSKRQKQLHGEVTDVFQYEDFPQPFRNQVIQILIDAFGEENIPTVTRPRHMIRFIKYYVGSMVYFNYHKKAIQVHHPPLIYLRTL